MSWLVYLEVAEADVELISSQLWSLGTTGIAELPGSKMVAGFRTQSGAEDAVAILGRGQVAPYDPSSIPSSAPVQVTCGSATIVLANTDVFGHGAHPTTKLALDALLRLAGPGTKVLDMGCGTGVLSIAAALVGAEVVAVDNDPAAVQATKTNAEANGVELDIRSELSPTEANSFDLVLANMLLADLRGVAGQLVELVSTGAVIATTGFLHGQLDQVLELYAPLTAHATYSSGDWVLAELA